MLALALRASCTHGPTPHRSANAHAALVSHKQVSRVQSRLPRASNAGRAIHVVLVSLSTLAMMAKARGLAHSQLGAVDERTASRPTLLQSSFSFICPPTRVGHGTSVPRVGEPQRVAGCGDVGSRERICAIPPPRLLPIVLILRAEVFAHRRRCLEERACLGRVQVLTRAASLLALLGRSQRRQSRLRRRFLLGRLRRLRLE